MDEIFSAIVYHVASIYSYVYVKCCDILQEFKEKMRHIYQSKSDGTNERRPFKPKRNRLRVGRQQRSILQFGSTGIKIKG